MNKGSETRDFGPAARELHGSVPPPGRGGQPEGRGDPDEAVLVSCAPPKDGHFGHAAAACRVLLRQMQSQPLRLLRPLVPLLLLGGKKLSAVGRASSARVRHCRLNGGAEHACKLKQLSVNEQRTMGPGLHATGAVEQPQTAQKESCGTLWELVAGLCGSSGSRRTMLSTAQPCPGAPACRRAPELPTAERSVHPRRNLF